MTRHRRDFGAACFRRSGERPQAAVLADALSGLARKSGAILLLGISLAACSVGPGIYVPPSRAEDEDIRSTFRTWWDNDSTIDPTSFDSTLRR
jgi:hypothetical protein